METLQRLSLVVTHPRSRTPNGLVGSTSCSMIRLHLRSVLRLAETIEPKCEILGHQKSPAFFSRDVRTLKTPERSPAPRGPMTRRHGRGHASYGSGCGVSRALRFISPAEE